MDITVLPTSPTGSESGTTGTNTTGTGASGDRPRGEQLSLLPSSDLPVRFRLDEATRRRGLRHVAEIRRMLDERQHAREDSPRERHLSRRRAA